MSLGGVKMSGLPPICHRFSEKIPKNMKRGLNIAELCYSGPLLLIYEVFRPAACSKMSTERAAITSVSCT